MKDEPTLEQHVTIVGDSGQGKTTLLSGIHNQCAGPSLWCDIGTGGDPDGRRVQSMQELSEMWSDTADPENFRAVVGTSNRFTTVARSVSFATEAYDRSGVPVQVCIPEAGSLMGGDRSENPIKWAMHEGRGAGVKVAMDTQDPSEYDDAAIKQTRYLVWVGKPSFFHEGFKRYYHLSSVAGDKLPSERFQYVVFDKGGNVVEEGSTDRFS